MRNLKSIRRPVRWVLFGCAAMIAGGVAIDAGVAVAQQEPIPISPRGLEAAPIITDSSSSVWTRNGVALGITIGAILLGLAIVRKMLPGVAAGSNPEAIQILAQRSLGSRGTVYTVRCGPRVLILGATMQQIATLAEIADPDEVDQFVRPSIAATANARRTRSDQTALGGDLKGQVHGMLEKLEAWNAQA